MVVGILFPLGSSSFHNKKNTSSINTLLTPCTIFKFNNNNMVANMLVEKPSYNRVESFVIMVSITTSCRPSESKKSPSIVIFSKCGPSFGIWSSLPCYNFSKKANAFVSIPWMWIFRSNVGALTWLNVVRAFVLSPYFPMVFAHIPTKLTYVKFRPTLITL